MCSRDLKPDETYTYHVLTVSRRAESEQSPPLSHQLGSPYCGDGLIQKSVYFLYSHCIHIILNAVLTHFFSPQIYAVTYVFEMKIPSISQCVLQPAAM